MSKIATKLRSKSVHVRITPELLVEAFMESLYFNKKVERIRVSMSRFGHECPNQNVYITCKGRGRLKGRVVKGVFHGTIYGTEKEIKAWLRFFKDFMEVPEFSLKNYIEWLKQNNATS